ncbi:hypothetical protein HZS_5351, partial [Henneguya salminicola]
MLDISFHVFDFICCSGLEGIKISNVWDTLSETGPYNKFGNITIDDSLKNFIIHTLINSNKISFYKLPQIFKDKEISEPKSTKKKLKYSIYNHDLKEYGVCRYYKIRQNITNEVISLFIAKKCHIALTENFGANVYMVANQESRNHVLNYYDVKECDLIEYCILEVIGTRRDKGFQQHLFLEYNLDSVRIYYEIINLMSQKKIFKIPSIVNNSEIPQNLLILSKFYDPNKIFHIYYISKSVAGSCPYDYYIVKACEIIRDHEITFKVLFDQLQRFYPNMTEVQFKNIVYYLHRSNLINIYESGELIQKKKIYILFPLKVKLLKDDVDSLYKDYWMIKSSDSPNWFLHVSFKNFNVEFGSRSIGEESEIPVSKKIHLTLTKKSFQELIKFGGFDYRVARRFLERLQNEKLLTSSTYMCGKIRIKRYFSLQFKHAQRSSLADDNPCLNVAESISHQNNLNLQKYIDNYIEDMPHKRAHFSNNVLFERLSFILSHMQLKNGIAYDKNSVYQAFNSAGKDRVYIPVTREIVKKLFDDLKALKIIKKITLQINYQSYSIQLYVYILSIPESTANWKDISEIFFNDIISKIPYLKLEKTDLFLEHIWNCTQKHIAIDLVNMPSDKTVISQNFLSPHQSSWIDEQYKLLRRLFTNYSRGQFILPKFYRVKLCHLYLFKLAYAPHSDCFESKNMGGLDNEFPWIESIKFDTKHKNGPGWFRIEDALYNLPLVLFISIVGPYIDGNVVTELIEMKSHYLQSFSSVRHKIQSISDSTIFPKFNYVFLLLFSLRIVGVKRNSLDVKISDVNPTNTNFSVRGDYLLLNIALKLTSWSIVPIEKGLYIRPTFFYNKSSLVLTKSVTLYDTIFDTELTIELNTISNVIYFWSELKNRSLKYDSPCKKTRVLSYRTYAEQVTTDPNEIVIQAVEPNGVLGFTGAIFLQLSKNWSFGSVIKLNKSKTTQTAGTAPRKRNIPIQKRQQQTFSKLYISSKSEKMLFQSYILYKIMDERFQKFQNYLPSITNACPVHCVYDKQNFKPIKKKIRKFFNHLAINPNMKLLTQKFIQHLYTIDKMTEYLEIKDLNEKSIAIYHLIEEKIAPYFMNIEIDSESFNRSYMILVLKNYQKKTLFSEAEKNITDLVKMRLVLFLRSLILKLNLFDEEINDDKIKFIFNTFGIVGYFILHSLKLLNCPSLMQQINEAPQLTPYIYTAIVESYFKSKLNLTLISHFKNKISHFISPLNAGQTCVHKTENPEYNASNIEIIVSPEQNNLLFNFSSKESTEDNINFKTFTDYDLRLCLAKIVSTRHHISENIVIDFTDNLLQYIEGFCNKGVLKSLVHQKVHQLCQQKSLTYDIGFECLDICVACKLIDLIYNIVQDTYVHSNYSKDWNIRPSQHIDNLNDFQHHIFVDETTGDIDNRLLSLICELIYSRIMGRPGIRQCDLINEFGSVMHSREVLRILHLLTNKGTIIELKTPTPIHVEKCLFFNKK